MICDHFNFVRYALKMEILKMKAFIFIFTLALAFVFCGGARADIYNECMKVDDDSSGLYFENGYAPTSPNSSDHYFEDIVVVAGGETYRFKITGDDLYGAAYDAAPGASQKLSLARRSYLAFDKLLKGRDGKSYLQVQFDLSSAQPSNGSVRGQLADGRAFSFDLRCVGSGGCASALISGAAK